jgi:outer membrane protein TolC
MKYRIWVLLIPFAWIINIPAFAAYPPEQDSTGVLNLKKALAICLKRYPSIKAKEALQQSVAGELAAARTEYLPQLILQDQYLFASTNNVQGATYSNGGTTISVTGGTREQNIYQGVWTSYATMLVDWKFFNFGKVKANIAIAENVLEKSRLELENEMFRQQVQVADAYLMLIATKQFVVIQQQNLERATAFRSAILANTLNGLRPGADSSLANAEVAKAKLSLLQAIQEEKTQRIRLARLIGWEQPVQEIDTAGLTNTLPALRQQPAEVDTAHSPLLRYYRSLVTLQQSRANATRRSVYPSLSFLSAGWARGSGIDNVSGHLNSGMWDGIQPRALNYMVGLAFRWNILSIPQVNRQYKSEVQKVRYTNYLLEETMLKTNAEMAGAKLRLETALEQVKQAPVQYGAALQAYQQSRARYESGLSALPELYQALYALNRAAADQLSAYNNVWRAILMEAAAAGDLSLFTRELQN